MCICECIYIILKHFLDKYFAPQELNQKQEEKKENRKTNWKTNLMLKSEDFFGDNI